MNKPCYTCLTPFINEKKQALLDNKRREAHQYAANNKITGALAIVPLIGKDGFKIVESSRLQKGDKPREFILFDKGIAL